MQIPDDRYEPISVDEAASRLRVSPSTVRRMIRDGKLQAEREQRPQGEIVRVLWPAAVADARDVPPPATPAMPAMPSSEPPGSAPTTAPANDLPAALSVALGPLNEALAAERAERQKLAQENAQLRERAARAESDAAHEKQRAADLARQLERERGRSLWKPWTW